MWLEGRGTGPAAGRSSQLWCKYSCGGMMCSSARRREKVGEAKNRILGNYPFLATKITFPQMILFLLPSPPSIPPHQLAPGLSEIWVSLVSCDSAFAEEDQHQTALTPGPGAQGGSFQHKAKSSHVGKYRKISKRWELMLSFPKEGCS